MALPLRTCCLDHCSTNHRSADCACCDAAVGPSLTDATSDVVTVHANVNTTNADPVPHVYVWVNDHDSGDYSPAVARQMAEALLEAANLAEAGALRR